MIRVIVIVDMQKDFTHLALGTAEALKIVPNVVHKIKTWDGKIFVTMDTHYKNYLQTLEGKNLPVEHCIKDTEGWQLHDDVLNALSDKEYTVFLKETFGSVDLANAIKELDATEGVSEIVFVGLCTGICVISNALLCKAVMPHIPIKVDTSCCACVTPESHKNAIEAMKLCQIECI